MALSRAQKKLIEATLIDQCNFPSDPMEFTQKEDELVIAFLEYINLNKENEFYWLKETFLNPGLHLKNLLTQGGDTTLGQVQTYILEFIETQLKATGNIPTQWIKKNWRPLIPRENFEIPFQSQAAAVDGGYSLWDLPEIETSIFTADLFIEYGEFESENFDYDGFPIISFQRLKVEIKPNIPRSNNIIYLTLNLRTQFANDAEEDKYYDDRKKDALALIRQVVAEKVITHLENKYSISKETRQKVNDSKALHQLITHQYFFNLLDKRKLWLKSICRYTQNQVDTLCNPAIIALLDKRILSVPQAASLSTPQVRVLSQPTYLGLTSNNQLEINDLQNITSKERAQFLIHPMIANLISLNQLSFNQAKIIPLHLLDIIANPFYKNLFTKTDIDWDTFRQIPAPQHKTLNHPDIVCFFSNDILSFENNIHTLIHSNKNELLTKLYIDAYFYRLEKLKADEPCQINSIPDTLEILKEFKDHLLNTIIINYQKDYLNNHALNPYENLHNKLREALEPKLSFDEKLKHISNAIHAAENELRQLSFRTTSAGPANEGLFSPAKKKQRVKEEPNTSFLQPLRDNLLVLESFNKKLTKQVYRLRS